MRKMIGVAVALVVVLAVLRRFGPALKLAGSLLAITIGMIVGLTIVASAAGWLQDLLFGISPRDPRILTAAAIVLMTPRPRS